MRPNIYAVYVVRGYMLIFNGKIGNSLRKMLFVERIDDGTYKVSLIFSTRSDPSRAEKKAGIKPKRKVIYQKNYLFKNELELLSGVKNLPESASLLVEQFLTAFKECQKI